VQNSLLEKTRIKGKTVVILGAGGAASAALYAFKKNKAKDIFVLNRTISHAKKLAEKFKCKYGEFNDFKDIHPDIVIQATSAGMNNPKGVQIIPKGLLKPNMAIMEMIYTPRMTRILKDAKAIGAKIITGERMLLHQGFAVFGYWTGKKAPEEIMEKAVDKRLN
jgi:shikimate 5-dehydrogenase